MGAMVEKYTDTGIKLFLKQWTRMWCDEEQNAICKTQRTESRNIRDAEYGWRQLQYQKQKEMAPVKENSSG